MEKRATEEALAELHREFANLLRVKLMSGGYALSASELNVIRHFLKDNNISCAGDYNEILKDIEAHLPEFNFNQTMEEEEFK